MPLTHRPWFQRSTLLGALLAFCAAPAGAQAIVLKHIPPGEILGYFRQMREGRGAGLPGYVAFPAGVTRITARPQDNALVVDATPEGFRSVREIAEALDVAPRRVSLTVSFRRVSDAQAAALGLPAPLDGGPGDFPVAAPPAPGAVAAFARSTPPAAVVTTANNVSTTLSLPAPGVRSLTLTLTPRVNADGTVTLTTHAQVTEEPSGAVGPGVTADVPTVTQDQTRTVPGGRPIILTERLFDAAGDAANDLLVVITPTVLADQP